MLDRLFNLTDAGIFKQILFGEFLFFTGNDLNLNNSIFPSNFLN